MYTVYILFSSKTQKFYIGQTQNIENRLFEHNSGETKSTKGGIPWIKNGKRMFQQEKKQ
jgi:putative endonuclease